MLTQCLFSSKIRTWRSFVTFYVIFLFWGMTLTHQALAKLRDFETTRLKSTAGAGVGSVLMDEATLLNPAPLVFYNSSSFYVSRSSSTFTGDDATQSSTNEALSKNSVSYGLIAADTKSAFKGSASYLRQQDGLDKRNRFALAVSTAMGKSSAIGSTVRYSVDEVNLSSGMQKKTYTQIDLGVLHAISSEFTLGILVKDLLNSKEKNEDTRVTLGGQYLIKQIMAIMLDIGMNYYKGIKDSAFYRGAIQVNFLADLYFRVGIFKDKDQQESGEGMGLGWISPRFVADLALKNSRPLDSTLSYNKIRDISFSLSFQF